ncbi:hypothetical protein [Streptoalloteichus hindustanus]|uniref:Uncharacterized protein n=1 Tax=Streptoalloteichus hindustanus TaxID=2017 RepID=A0A1M5DR68_STRHI|nr:hypothetical protein [Streptoalloteichus hindustanus]SHF69477.1 hypothetical protein SAMN05444320_104570 [Streptoalloteichus hindustanus]
MRPPNDETGTWESSWLAAMMVLKSAQRVFTPGNRPPAELIPLVEPVIRLRDALRASPPDQEEARRRAADLVADRDLITWACQPHHPSEIQEFGASLGWLATALTA